MKPYTKKKEKKKVSFGFLSKEWRKNYITIIHLNSNTDIQEIALKLRYWKEEEIKN